MKKEIKNFGKIVEIILIILTIVSLIITSLEYTNMVYNVVLVSGVQQSDSVVHIHISLFKFFSHLIYYRILSRVPCAMQ